MFLIDSVSGQLLWEGAEQECPLEVFTVDGDLFSVQYNGINAYSGLETDLSLQRRYSTPLMVANQVQAASVINNIILLALLDGDSTLQALWV